MLYTLLVSVLFFDMPAAGAPAQHLPSGRELRLADALAMARARQPQVKKARAEVSAAAGRTTSATAPLLPQLALSASYQHGYGSFRGAGFGTGANTGATGGNNAAQSGVFGAGARSSFDFVSAGVSATQLIWDFGRTWNQRKAAVTLEEAAKDGERASLRQVTLAAKQAFFVAWGQRALVGVARDTLRNLEAHRAQVEGFVRAGTRPEVDLAQAKTDVANGRAQLISAENQYGLVKIQLFAALGMTATVDTLEVAEDEEPALPLESASTGELYASAVDQRPELVALERQREGQSLTARSLRGGYWPSLSATGSASITGTGLDALGPNWNVGASVMWPLFQGGITRGQVAEASALQLAAQADLDAQKLAVRTEVEQARLSVQSAKAMLEANAEALDNSRERLRLAQGRYDSGVGSFLELSDAEVSVAQARAQWVQGRVSLSTARAQLAAAIGVP